MLTLDLMKRIRLEPIPTGQITTASLLVGPNYSFPLTRTKIVIEGIERIPKTGRVIVAMNHTDRYNYFPFQYDIWRKLGMYTVTWVKGKYYQSPLMARFMAATNNIPTPSRGYLLTVDMNHTLGHAPSGELYRIMRDALDGGVEARDMERLREQAREAGQLADFERVTRTGRPMLGITFDPAREDYFAALDRLFGEMMQVFLELNQRAFELGHKVIVFPEGTRSLRLLPGRPGLAQMALRMRASILPVGCNGSERIYPGDLPFSRGGEVVYRVGELMTPEDALAPYQIHEPYTPFTREAESKHGAAFEGMTTLMMSRIAELIEPRYLSSEPETAVSGSNRFL